MGNKKAAKQRAEKKFLYVSIIVFVVGTLLLTSVFLHFDMFTYKSVFYEYTEQEIVVNEKIKENTHYVKTDGYGDMLIPRSLVSSETVSYFETDDSNVRILAYADNSLNYLLGYDLCQRCVSQGKNGWFYEHGGYLCCSVCGKGIELSELGKRNPSSGVHPVLVTRDMFEIRQNVIAIPKETLDKPETDNA